MNDRVLGIVADFVAAESPRLRAELTERLARDLAVTPDEAKRVVRDLLEDGVIDPVTVCHYRAADGRVVLEAGLARGAGFPALHPVGA